MSRKSEKSSGMFFECDSSSCNSLKLDLVAEEGERIEDMVDPVCVNGVDYSRDKIWKYVVDHGTCPKGLICFI